MLVREAKVNQEPGILLWLGSGFQGEGNGDCFDASLLRCFALFLDGSIDTFVPWVCLGIYSSSGGNVGARYLVAAWTAVRREMPLFRHHRGAGVWAWSGLLRG